MIVVSCCFLDRNFQYISFICVSTYRVEETSFFVAIFVQGDFFPRRKMAEDGWTIEEEAVQYRSPWVEVARIEF
jgi:hypothetical protein